MLISSRASSLELGITGHPPQTAAKNLLGSEFELILLDAAARQSDWKVWDAFGVTSGAVVGGGLLVVCAVPGPFVTRALRLGPAIAWATESTPWLIFRDN